MNAVSTPTPAPPPRDPATCGGRQMDYGGPPGGGGLWPGRAVAHIDRLSVIVPPGGHSALPDVCVCRLSVRGRSLPPSPPP